MAVIAASKNFVQSAHVPKFGSWEGKAIQFTMSFEDARRDRVAGFNPNDPVLNPEAFSSSQPNQQQNQKYSATGQKGFSSSPKRPQIDQPRLSSSKMEPRNDVHQKPRSLPKFGGWNESGQKAEYTVIFNEVKEKKLTAATTLPAVPTNTAASKNNHKTSSKLLCCFFL